MVAQGEPAPQLTPEQRAIIEADAPDIVVSAGAGSGKTFVLVERYLALLGRHRIPELVAVTFTEAAAAEMRERVRRAVLERDAFTEHRADLDQAAIGTIHSLCLQLLREHPVEAGIDPRARVLPEDESELLLLSASVDALEAAAEADDQRAIAIREIGLWFLTQQLPQMVARRDEVREAFAALPGDTPAEWAAAIHARLDAELERAAEAAREPVAACLVWVAEQRRPGGSDALTKRCDEAAAAFGDPFAGDSRDWLERLRTGCSCINLQGGGKANWVIPVAAVKDRLREVRELGKATDALPAWTEHDGLALESLDALQAIFEDACTRYDHAKRELHALDFLDLELGAVALLREHPSLAAAQRARLRHVLVDEVQDTNPLQVELIRLLTGQRVEASAATGEGGPHLFLVGDAKQSIYRFRGADVRQFNRLRAEIEARQGLVLPLSRSFRTHDALVEQLNELFEHVFADAEADFEARMERMSGRGAVAPAPPHVTLQPIANSGPNGERAKEYDQRRTEADLLAAEIRSILDGREVWDPEARAVRPARPRDVAILLRRLANVHIFEQALEAHGVPYATPSGAGFFTRQEILDLTNLLTWLAETDDEIALAGALRSPLFLLDDPTLLALREAGGSLIGALRRPPGDLAPPARERARYAANILDGLLRLAETAGVADVLDHVLSQTGVEAVWGTLDGGAQAVANIRKLARMARTLSSYSLDAFATYLRQRRDELTAREGQAVLDQRDAVTVMTVHGAKGLEFPIVFVPEAHLPWRTTYEAVRWRREDGIAVSLQRELGEDTRRRTGFYDLLLQLDQAEEAAEHRRLFYVAATRAADSLFISGDSSGNRGWLHAAQRLFGQEPVDDEPATGVLVRAEAIPDPAALASRPAPRAVEPPDAADEVDYTPPLLARPRVIPVRASTPVTALRASDPEAWRPSSRGAGDGLGTLRGRVAHRAIELSFAPGGRPPLATLIDQEQELPLPAPVAASLAAEVKTMLEHFEASDLGRQLRDPATEAHFELPFAWDWDGVPVHGVIDLAYRSTEAGGAGGVWHIVDFKTDELRSANGTGPDLVSAAEPYLSQLGLYGRALEAVVGARPTVSLLFLRTGNRYQPAWSDIEAALDEARRRVDAGALLDPDLPEYALDEVASE